ncbi:hypothetical protein ACLK1X_11320 [Escherichia coli]
MEMRLGEESGAARRCPSSKLPCDNMANLLPVILSHPVNTHF